MKIITTPAGIEWRRTGRQSWVVTVRREPETVFEWEPGDFNLVNAQLLPGCTMGVGLMGSLGLGGIF